jgi:hypothetical protein
MNSSTLGTPTSLAEVTNIDHLFWPDLDVDLCLDSLQNPESFPMIHV